MAMDRLSLSRFLELMQLPHARRLRMIERDARRAVYVEQFGKDADGGGGDFYGPFWADAKRSAVDDSFDLASATVERIASNKSRRRLYPVLLNGFESGWAVLRQARISGGVITLVSNLAVTLKGSEGEDRLRATNALSVQEAGTHLHITYPYFSKDVGLGTRHARLGLAVLKQGFASAKPKTVAILDVLRGNLFVGDEVIEDSSAREQVVERYDAVMREWRAQKRLHSR